MYYWQAKPLKRYSEKYTNEYQLNEKLIGKFGRQILEVLFGGLFGSRILMNCISGLGIFKIPRVPLFPLTFRKCFR
jgi:hypothetical protein